MTRASWGVTKAFLESQWLDQGFLVLFGKIGKFGKFLFNLKV